MSDDNSVSVEEIGRCFYVWSLEHVEKLRNDHKILGSFFGCLPLKSFQNDILGLPLKLCKCEVALLCKLGVCKVVRRVKNGFSSSDEESLRRQASLAEYRDTQQIEQSRLCHQAVIDERLSNLDHIIAGKLAKKAKKRKFCNKNCSISCDDESTRIFHTETVPTSVELKINAKDRLNFVGEVNEKDRMEVELEIRRAPMAMLKRDKILVQLPMCSTFDRNENFEPVHVKSNKFESRDMLKSRVFEDLHKKGYYLTSGFKFGGDFLVYEGDPLLFHAIFIALIVPDKNALTDLDRLAYCRLGCRVKKIFLLCYVDQSKSTLLYERLLWRKTSI